MYRCEGISTEMLQSVIEDSRKGGYGDAEVYPNMKKTDMFQNDVDLLRFYKKFDFEPYAETKRRLVMPKNYNRDCCRKNSVCVDAAGTEEQ